MLPPGPALSLPPLRAPSGASRDERVAVSLYEQGDVERAVACFSDVALTSRGAAVSRGYEGLVRAALDAIATSTRSSRDCGDPVRGSDPPRMYSNGRLKLLWSARDALPCMSAAARATWAPLLDQLDAELATRCGPIDRARYIGGDVVLACGEQAVGGFRGLGAREAGLGIVATCPESAESALGGLGTLGRGGR